MACIRCRAIRSLWQLTATAAAQAAADAAAARWPPPACIAPALLCSGEEERQGQGEEAGAQGGGWAAGQRAQGNGRCMPVVRYAAPAARTVATPHAGAISPAPTPPSPALSWRHACCAGGGARDSADRPGPRAVRGVGERRGGCSAVPGFCPLRQARRDMRAALLRRRGAAAQPAGLGAGPDAEAHAGAAPGACTDGA